MTPGKLVGGALLAVLALQFLPAIAATAGLSGQWELRYDSRSVPPASLTASARQAAAQHRAADLEGLRWCRIAGLPLLMEGPLDIQQGRIEIAIVAPLSSVARHIYTDGRAQVSLQDFEATTNGNSVGHWEGATLVVDTIGFSERGMVSIPGGGFRSGRSHLTERYRLSDDGQQLLVSFSWTDPGVYARPHSYEFRYFRAPASRNVIEWPCEPFAPDRARFFAPAMAGRGK